MRYHQAARVQSRYPLRDTSGSGYAIYPTDHPAKKDHIKLAPTPTAAVMDLAEGLSWAAAGRNAFQFVLRKESEARTVRRPERRNHTFRARQWPAGECIERADPELRDFIYSDNERY